MKDNDILYDCLCTVGVPVVYANTDSKLALPYITYLKYGEKYQKADNRICETVDRIQVDYFTGTQEDSKADDITEALDKLEIPFEYSCIVDDDIFHHIWDCEVI